MADVPLESWSITRQCRINKGAPGAWQEAVASLEIVYGVQQARKPRATFRLALFVDDQPVTEEQS